MVALTVILQLLGYGNVVYFQRINLTFSKIRVRIVKIMRSVLLLREKAREYTEAFDSNSLCPVFLPVLEFNLINLEELSDYLVKNEHAGLVLTSPRAASACCSVSSTGLDTWKEKPVFVVGKATEHIVNVQLRLPCKGSDTGNADRLAELIISERKSFDNTKPLLFPCGNLKRDILPTKLAKAKIELECLTVYTTEMKHSLKNDFVRLQQSKGIPPDIVFFSPSGVDYVIPILKEISYDLDQANLVAIGPSTEERIRKWKLTPYATAAVPTTEAIVSVFKKT